MKQFEAKALGLPRYYGKVCEKHPDLRGERYTCNWGCISCGLEAVLRNSNTPSGRERIRAFDRRPEHLAKKRARMKLPHMQSYLKEYRRSERYRRSAAIRAASPKTRLRMAQYRKLPEQKAARAMRGRLFYQHVSKYATPSWANRFFIGETYDLAKLRTQITGIRYEVDHIIPLVSKVVCGLHVEANLQILTHSANRRKSNKLLPELIG